jgi:hypothetical protein
MSTVLAATLHTLWLVACASPGGSTATHVADAVHAIAIEPASTRSDRGGDRSEWPTVIAACLGIAVGGLLAWRRVKRERER